VYWTDCGLCIGLIMDLYWTDYGLCIGLIMDCVLEWLWTVYWTDYKRLDWAQFIMWLIKLPKT